MKYFHNYKEYLNEAVFVKKTKEERVDILNKLSNQGLLKVKPFFNDLIDVLKTGDKLLYMEKVLELVENTVEQKDVILYFEWVKNTHKTLFETAESTFIRCQKLFGIWSKMHKSEKISKLFNISITETISSLFDGIKDILDEENGELPYDHVGSMVDFLNDKENKVCLDFTSIELYVRENSLEKELIEFRKAIKDFVYINDIDKSTGTIDIESTNGEDDIIIKNPKEYYENLDLMFNIKGLNISKDAIEMKEYKGRKTRTPHEQELMQAYIKKKGTQKCTSCGETKPLYSDFIVSIKSPENAPQYAFNNYTCRACTALKAKK